MDSAPKQVAGAKQQSSKVGANCFPEHLRRLQPHAGLPDFLSIRHAVVRLQKGLFFDPESGSPTELKVRRVGQGT